MSKFIALFLFWFMVTNANAAWKSLTGDYHLVASTNCEERILIRHKHLNGDRELPSALVIWDRPSKSKNKNILFDINVGEFIVGGGRGKISIAYEHQGVYLGHYFSNTLIDRENKKEMVSQFRIKAIVENEEQIESFRLTYKNYQTGEELNCKYRRDPV